jgi:3-hydroxyacyl-CoA dehydrogenase
VVSGVTDGFIGNRMIEQYSRQAGFLLDEGATPQQVDRAIEKFGFAMGPFRMGDLAGNDIGWAIRKRRAQERPNMLYSRTADKLCELGRFGQKTGAGWYDYQAGKRDAIPSKLVEDMIVEHRKSLGITPRKISDEEIVQRLVFSLVNEARTSWKRASPRAPATSTWSTSRATASPSTAAARCCTRTRSACSTWSQAMKRFQQNPRDDAKFWEPAPLLLKLAQKARPSTDFRGPRAGPWKVIPATAGIQSGPNQRA